MNRKIINIYKSSYIFFVYIFFYDFIITIFNIPRYVIEVENFNNKTINIIINHIITIILTFSIVGIIYTIREKKHNYYKIMILLAHAFFIIMLIYYIGFYYNVT